MLLHNPARIDALFCCHFLALLISALIEREVRTGMRRAALNNIALYPELRAAAAGEEVLGVVEALASSVEDLQGQDAGPI